MKCPEECKAMLIEHDLNVILDETYKNKYQNFELKNYIDQHGDDSSWCPTANCKYAFIKSPDVSEFACPMCAKYYCLNCRVEYHKGQSCQEWRVNNTYSESDKAFEKFVKVSKFKQCGKCKFWVEKKEGCNYIKCRCGQEFCYACGGPRGVCKCGGFSGH